MEADRKKTLPVVLKYGLLIFLASIAVVLVTLAMPLAIRAFVLEAFKIPSATMAPTLLPGDHILVKKFNKEPGRSDVIVFQSPENKQKNFVKRVVGIAGDIVQVRNKQLYINNKPVTERYVVHVQIEDESTKNLRHNFGPVTVPPNALFVLGDNRDFSRDSRDFGFVDKSAVKGKVSTIYWSWDGENEKVRWERIGKAVQ